MIIIGVFSIVFVSYSVDNLLSLKINKMKATSQRIDVIQKVLDNTYERKIL